MMSAVTHAKGVPDPVPATRSVVPPAERLQVKGTTLAGIALLKFPRQYQKQRTSASACASRNARTNSLVCGVRNSCAK